MANTAHASSFFALATICLFYRTTTTAKSEQEGDDTVQSVRHGGKNELIFFIPSSLAIHAIDLQDHGAGQTGKSSEGEKGAWGEKERTGEEKEAEKTLW